MGSISIRKEAGSGADSGNCVEQLPKILVRTLAGQRRMWRSCKFTVQKRRSGSEIAVPQDLFKVPKLTSLTVCVCCFQTISRKQCPARSSLQARPLNFLSKLLAIHFLWQRLQTPGEFLERDFFRRKGNSAACDGGCWIALHDGHRRDGLGHHTASGDDGTVSDGDVGKND